MPAATSFDFAIVGVTDGKAFTLNSCFVEQYAWANRGTTEPGVYINVNGLPSGWTSPACVSDEPNCEAYAYGKGAADTALAYADISGVFPARWWLDIETENYWTKDLLQNAFVIRGAMEALLARGLSVGVYSTPYQWAQIAGGYAPGLDVWTAGASDLADAASRCKGDAYTFNGGHVKLVQFVAGNLDTDLVCE